MAAMALLSVCSLFGLGLSGLAIGIGAVLFFFSRSRECIGYRQIPHLLRRPGVCLLLAAPAVLYLLVIILSLAGALPYELIHMLIVQIGTAVPGQPGAELFLSELLFLALAQEFAWRAYFQRTLQQCTGGQAVPVVLLTALLFAVGNASAQLSLHSLPSTALLAGCHILLMTAGSFCCGLLFFRTNNVLLSAAANFLGNLVLVLLSVVQT